jgi:hypothetical protein
MMHAPMGRVEDIWASAFLRKTPLPTHFKRNIITFLLYSKAAAAAELKCLL